MMNINLNLFMTFYIVANSNTIIEASEKLFISQPAVSKNIKTLENNLGTQLFYRTKRGIKLTEDGRKLYEYIEKAFNYMHAGEKVVRDSNQLQKGSLTIGVQAHIAGFYVLDLIEKFTLKYPNIKINLISKSTKELINDLYNHKLDFVIDSYPIDIVENYMIIKELKEFETTLVASSKLKIKKINEKNVKDYKFILPIEHSLMMKNLRNELINHKIILEADYEVDTTDVTKKLIQKGLGIGYIVKKAIAKEIESQTLTEVEFPFELPKLKVNLVYMKNYITNTSNEFIENYLDVRINE